MKPTSLRPGDKVISDPSTSGTVLTFSRRCPSECGRPAANVFTTPSGELVTANDYTVSRQFKRA